METFNSLALFLVGFYILIKGAKTLIKGASSLGRLFGMSSWAIAIFIIGIGTSIPEFSINLVSLFDETAIGLGTIIGSNTFNILFILGLSALITPLVVRPEWVKKDFTINIAVILLVVLFAVFPVIGSRSFEGIARAEGLILLALFIGWIWSVSRRKREEDEEIDTEYQAITVYTALFMILAGIVGVFFGGRWVVGGAETIARLLGASEAFIGLTLVAVGTSVPEMTVSLVAAFKKQTTIAVGNIIGSNVFDFLGILGIGASIKPIAFPGNLFTDILVTLTATLLLLATVFVGKRYIIKRWQGALLVSGYLAYFVFLLARG